METRSCAHSSYVDEGVFNDEGVEEDVSMDEIERVIEREVKMYQMMKHTMHQIC